MTRQWQNGKYQKLQGHLLAYHSYIINKTPRLFNCYKNPNESVLQKSKERKKKEF